MSYIKTTTRRNAKNRANKSCKKLQKDRMKKPIGKDDHVERKFKSELNIVTNDAVNLPDHVEVDGHGNIYRKELVGITVGSFILNMGMILIIFVLCIWKRKIQKPGTTSIFSKNNYCNKQNKEDLDLETFDLSIIAKAWTPLTEGRPLQLMDVVLGKTCSSTEVIRCIQVGLLCAQQRPVDRPDMSSVVLMLNDDKSLPKPKVPAFFNKKDEAEENSSFLSLSILLPIFTSKSSNLEFAQCVRQDQLITIAILALPVNNHLVQPVEGLDSNQITSNTFMLSEQVQSTMAMLLLASQPVTQPFAVPNNANGTSNQRAMVTEVSNSSEESVHSYPEAFLILHVRDAAYFSAFALSDHTWKRNHINKKLAVTLASITALILGISLGSMIYVWRKHEKPGKANFIDRIHHTVKHDKKDIYLPILDLSTIANATSNFSVNNLLGEGGFGPVYKGALANGQEIAVKRLSKNSGQGLDEFRNEVAWRLWNEGAPLELMDVSLGDSIIEVEALKIVQVGLLCVQERPEDRPSMSKCSFDAEW
ncbi:hypothetical protein RJT34_29102 [Clitoria ternatea]|uniref:Protein kinase domain-containing protein n=1 Tax=Clitoria ternatea TaxID=43366 RepID=A0AAN9I9G9_CLITE